MKPYLVDVPVKINIWIRTECQKKQFDVIKEARPSILFIQSDGGRNQKEWDAIYQNRKLIDEGIDWECTVYRLYEEKNNGLYTMSQKIDQLVWSKVNECIFLEDDQVPAVSYFKFCAELLEKYKNDERIECICGMNQLGIYEEVNSDYFFSRQGSIWGIATWKRVALQKHDFSYINDSYVMKRLQQRMKYNKSAWDQLNAYGRQKYYNGHIASAEFFFEFDMYAQNRLQIIPKMNMISNIGATADSSHADDINLLPRGIRKVFNMPLYEIDRPIIHPEYVIADINYEKKRNRVMGYNSFWINLFRKLERLYLLIKHGQFKKIIRKFKNVTLEK